MINGYGWSMAVLNDTFSKVLEVFILAVAVSELRGVSFVFDDALADFFVALLVMGTSFLLTVTLLEHACLKGSIFGLWQVSWAGHEDQNEKNQNVFHHLFKLIYNYQNI